MFKTPFHIATVPPTGSNGCQSSMKDRDPSMCCKTWPSLGLQNPWDFVSLPFLCHPHPCPWYFLCLQCWVPLPTCSTCHSPVSAVGPQRPRGAHLWDGAQGHNHWYSRSLPSRRLLEATLLSGAGLWPVWTHLQRRAGLHTGAGLLRAGAPHPYPSVNHCLGSEMRSLCGSSVCGPHPGRSASPRLSRTPSEGL